MSAIEDLLQQPAALAIAWALLQFVWQGALIGALTALALLALRSSAADIRYVVATIGLAVMLTMPVMTAVQTLTAMEESAQPMAGHRAVLSDLALENTSRPMMSLSEPALRSSDESGAGSSPIGERVDNAAEITRNNAAAAGSGSPTTAIVTSITPNAVLMRVMLMAWSVGVVILTLRLLTSWILVRRLTSRGTSVVAAGWQEAVARLSKQLHVRRPIRLLQSAIVEVPTVIGWVRPVLLIPASALAGLSPRQLEAILAHELAHIRRHDYLVNLLQTLVETLLFYHPAVWWLSRRIRIEREHCCDDLAVSLCGDPYTYARALADLEGLRSEAGGLALAATGGSLLHRVRRLLGAPSHAGRGPGWLAGTASVLVLTAIAAGAVGRNVLRAERASAVVVNGEAVVPVTQSTDTSPVVVPSPSGPHADVGRRTSPGAPPPAPVQAPAIAEPDVIGPQLHAVHIGDLVDHLFSALRHHLGFDAWEQPVPPVPPPPPATAPQLPSPPPPPPQPRGSLEWTTPIEPPTPPVPSVAVVPPVPPVPPVLSVGPAGTRPVPPVPPAPPQPSAVGIERMPHPQPIVPLAPPPPAPPRPLSNPPAPLSAQPALPAPPVPPAPPAPPSERGISINQSSSRTVHSWSDGNEKVRIEIEGKVEFTDDDKDVKSVTPGGFLRIEDGNRSIEIRADESGALSRHYRVDATERPFEPEGRQWLAERLPRFIRQSGIGADRRVARILAAGGPARVLEEISAIRGSWAKRVYFTELLEAAKIDAPLAQQILTQAGREIDSDYELASLLIGSANRLLIEGGTRKAFVDAAATIESDYEMRRAYSSALERSPTSPELAVAILDASAAIGSDYEHASLLLQLVERQGIEGPVRAPFFRALEGVGSAYERGRVLQAVARRKDVSPESALNVVRAISGMGDYESSQVLKVLAANHPMSGGARDAYIAAAERLGRYEQSQALAALAKSR